MGRKHGREGFSGFVGAQRAAGDWADQQRAKQKAMKEPAARAAPAFKEWWVIEGPMGDRAVACWWVDSTGSGGWVSLPHATPWDGFQGWRPVRRVEL